ncbi:hypothetical protein [Comamonas sp. GB3 AK4-5]|uniref:hypothetical protein n=1 Tax=Comamonas sp. GB3 AK4-5 TaxID=3231487 RepID=UPI00351DBE46
MSILNRVAALFGGPLQIRPDIKDPIIVGDDFIYPPLQEELPDSPWFNKHSKELIQANKIPKQHRTAEEDY